MSAPSILVVDSDGEHAAACASFLKDSGFAVTVVRDLRSAEAAVSAGELDLVLLDSSLDGSDTSPIAISAQKAGAEVFGMSDIHVGATNREIAVGLHGCVDHWNKPVSAHLALEWFQRVLGDRFPTPGVSRSLEVGAEAARVRGAGTWGDRPTNVTPVDPTDLISDVGSELPDLDATPVPGGGRPELGAPTRGAPLEPSAAPLKMSKADAEEPTPGAPKVRVDSRTEGLQLLTPEQFQAQAGNAGGDLAETTFAAVFAAETGRRTTGALRVESGGVSKEIFLQDGDVVGVRSGAIEDSLGAILLSDGLLRADQEEAIRRNMGASALEIPATFVEAEVVALEDLPTIERIVVERRMQRVFAWTVGTWALTNQVCPSAVRISSPVVGRNLLERGVRYGMNTEVLRSVMAAQLRRRAGWKTDPPAGPFLGWEQSIVGKIDGKTRTSNVILGAPDRDEALRFVALLVLSGHVGFEA